MTSYRYLGYGVTDSNGVAHLKKNAKDQDIDGYTGVGAGEIDIIARQKDTYLFVEVKTRHDNPLGRPYEAVDYRKRRRILKTAITYIREHHLDANYRCDICEVYVDRETLDLHKINYFKNAFVPESDFGYY